MTTFLWILLVGFILSLVLAIIFGITKKRIGLLLSVIVCVMCFVFFAIDTSLNPIKNTDSVSQMAESINLEEMVSDYRSNEISAKEKYYENRYRLSAEIVSIEVAGLREGFSGYNVGMEAILVDEVFYLCANFQGDMKDDILELEVGDTLTFTGKCIAPELWYNCTIVEVE